jgi:hypothetical protein
MMSLEMATESNPLNGRRGAPAAFFHGGSKRCAAMQLKGGSQRTIYGAKKVSVADEPKTLD